VTVLLAGTRTLTVNRGSGATTGFSRQMSGEFPAHKADGLHVDSIAHLDLQKSSDCACTTEETVHTCIQFQQSAARVKSKAQRSFDVFETQRLLVDTFVFAARDFSAASTTSSR